MRRPAIRTLLTMLFAASVLLIVAPVAAAVLALEWRSAIGALNHHLEEDLAVASELLRRTPSGIGWAYAGAEDPGYDAAAQRWVEVFDAGGGVRYVRGEARLESVRGVLPPAPPDGRDFSTVTIPGGSVLRLYTAARDIGGEPLVIRVARTEDAIRDQWNGLLLTFLVVIPAAVGLASAAGYVIAGRALAPIARITERARRITADRLDARLPVENPGDELGELAKVFNATFERLEASFQRLKRFTADASHELRTPLTAIRSVGEVGLRNAKSAEDYREVIGSMLEESDRLTRLVTSLLTISRWEAGQVRLSFGVIDLPAMAAAIVGQLGVVADDKGVALRCRSEGPLPVLADQEMLHQAIVNVIDNAIKYTPSGGAVDVVARRAGAVAELHVSDQGPGIPAEHVSRVFDRFYRIDKGRGRSDGGAGLGLAIARGAVEINKGRIDVYPADGGGSRFVISLPCAGQA